MCSAQATSSVHRLEALRENVCCASLAGRRPGRTVVKLLCFECWSSALHIQRCRRRLDSRRQIGQVRDALPRVALSLSLDALLATTAKLTRTLRGVHEPDRHTRPCHCLHSRSRACSFAVPSRQLARHCQQPRVRHSSDASPDDPKRSINSALC